MRSLTSNKRKWAVRNRRLHASFVFLLAVLAIDCRASAQTIGNQLRNAKQFDFVVEDIDKAAEACGITNAMVRDAFNFPASSAAFEIVKWRAGLPTIHFQIVTIHSLKTSQCFSMIELGIIAIENVRMSYSNADVMSTIMIWTSTEIHYSAQARHEQNSRQIVENLTKRFITAWNLDNKK